MRFITNANWLILLLWGVQLVGYFQLSMTASPFMLIDAFTFIGMLLVQLVFLRAWKGMYGFTLVLLYTLALFQGLRIMLSFGPDLTGLGIMTIVIEFILIVYLIGVRGFMKSNVGRSSFGLALQEGEPKS